jgi:tight adherence protein C
MRSTQLRNFDMDQWLPSGLHVDDLIALAAGVAVLAVLFVMWQALRSYGSPFERRLANIVERRETLRRTAVGSRRGQQRLSPGGWMHRIVSRLDLLRSRHADEARAKLARAGFRSRDAMVGYLFAQVSLPAALGLAMVLDTYVLHLVPIRPALQFLPVLAAVLLGFYAPKLYLKNAADKRAKKLKLALPDGLDLTVICAEAGLSLDATLLRVSRELANSWPELAEELAITAAELTFLPDRRLAFDNLNSRTNIDGIRAVVNTLQQTAKFGTPLAQSLRILASEMRALRMTAAEEKAARLPALMTVPMIMFILPTLFIVLIGPAAIAVYDTMSAH